MNAGTFVYVGAGRVRTTLAVPTHRAPNAVPFGADGAISVNTDPAARVAARVSGIPYGPSGRIVVDMSGGAVVSSSGGLSFTASGKLACDAAGEVDHYVRGIPVTAEGRVCIDTPTPSQVDEGVDDA